MDFTMTHKFDFPVETVTDILKAGEDLFPMEELQNVSARTRIYQKREGSRILRKYEWNVHGQIPPLAQKIFKPETLMFIEESVWDDDRCCFESRIIPHHFKNVMKVTSKSTWSAAPGGGAQRRIESSISINIPVVGPIAEKVIIEHFKKNNDQSAEMIRKNLAKKSS